MKECKDPSSVLQKKVILKSLIIFFETGHADVEAKNWIENTPINNASYYGYLEIVKYLHETCHTDVETKDDDIINLEIVDMNK